MIKIVQFFFLFCFAICSAQQTDYIDFKKESATISFDVYEKKVEGVAELKFAILKGIDSIYLDAVNMSFSDIKINGKTAKYNYKENKLFIYSDFKSDSDYILELHYKCHPKNAMYFIGWKNSNSVPSSEVEKQIWTQGQGKYTSNWLPSIDDMNEKIEFDLTIKFLKDYIVIANGELVNVERKDFINYWRFDMKKPMSSYLVAFAIGNYNKKIETSQSGIPLEYYYYPEDSAKVESTYRYSKQMFDFLEEEIGVPYPWEIYKQVPVKDFLYSGMENTTMTIFSDALVTDSIAFRDRNYVNVNAHELAHQWFGDFVTETSGTHHWLHEGFATYYALLAERNIFGDNYYYWKLYEYAQQLLELEKAGESTSLLDPKSSSLTFYQKGCWALHILKEQVGEEVFREAVKSYLLTYQYKNVETSNFIKEVEEASGKDLTEFFITWLEKVGLPQDAMVQSLKKSEFIQEYMNVDCETYPSKCEDYLVSDISDKAKVKVISQESYSVKKEDFNTSWEVRQAIAQNLTEIPLELKKSYESLLNDTSYLTIEAALYNLWVNFPEERSKYLQKTKDILGFSDYNVRLLWLALNLNTIEYQSEKKQSVFDELKSYTSQKYGFEIRMNAFNYLKLIGGFDEFSIKNLMDATHHHYWRFQQYAKNLLEELRQNPKYLDLIDNNTIKQ